MTGPDPVDLLVEGTLVNVTTGQLEDRAIAVEDGEIVGFGPRPARERIQADYVTPGLIDAHMHVEVSMVTIPQYGDAAIPHGVTAVVHDPHEIANVLGPEGVRDFCADADRTPLKAGMTVPSSVPASELQDTGGVLDSTAVEELLALDDAIALGEVMDLDGVLAGDDEIHAKIAHARDRGLPVDGHVPGVTGSDLQELARYLDTDHESVELAEARAKADAGMYVYLREGSTSKNLDALVDLVDAVDTRRLALCTDERNVVDLVESGGVNTAVRKAMDLGVDPVTAVQLATVNVADVYDLPIGRVEPGAPADMVLLSDLESWTVDHVVVDGELDPTASSSPAPESALPRDTVTFDRMTPADLAIDHDGPGPVRVRAASAIGSFRTERLRASVPVDSRAEGTVLGANPDDDVLPMAVIERHGGPGNVGRGFVHNLGLDRGAVGTTVAHDAHNCVVAGVTHDGMARVANELRDVGGGLCVFDPECDDCTTLPLPIAGLLAAGPIEETAAAFEAVTEATDAIGLSVPGGIMELSYLALEVIPTYRLTNNGLVDVAEGSFVDVVAE
jgi:adenine deaminase